MIHTPKPKWQDPDFMREASLKASLWSQDANRKPTINRPSPDTAHSRRLDQVLAELFPDYSRSRLSSWIKAGAVQVDGLVIDKPRFEMFGGELIELNANLEVQGSWQAQNIELDLRYADEHILVVHKPAGLVVHPGAGNADGTLLNALLNYDADLDKLPRAGVVHRLDKDTSGLMVVARSQAAHTRLVEMIQSRQLNRQYEALVLGLLTSGGKVDAPIGRDPVHRTRMAVNLAGKEAVTHYRLIERYRIHSHIRLKLETGRTHQIRVHMAHVKHPLLGDPTYGGRMQVPAQASDELLSLLRNFRRQALHAVQLGFNHPISHEAMQWNSELPEDFQQMVRALRDDRRAHRHIEE